MHPQHDFDGLLKIFQINKKKDLIKHCKSIVIHGDDFANLIMVCDAFNVGLIHKIYTRDFVPEHLHPTKEDAKALDTSEEGKFQGKGLKFVRKINQIFRDRRFVVGHLFYTPDLQYWHFFYFDQRDIAEYDNHWQFGSHIHFINYLWRNYDAKSIWQTFQSDDPFIKGSLHIRYDEDRDEKLQYNFR